MSNFRERAFITKYFPHFLIFLIIFSIASTLYSGYNAYNLMHRCTAVTVGKIVDVHRHSKNNIDADVEYIADQCIVQSNVKCSRYKRPNEQVEVHYNPNKLNECYIGSRPYEVTKAVVFFIVTLVIGIYAIVRKLFYHEEEWTQ